MKSLTHYNYRSEDEYWEIRGFLRELFLINNRRETNWHVNRWDYWRWHVNENIDHLPLEEIITLWRTSNGKIAAVLTPEGKGDITFQVHPDYHCGDLLQEMVDIAEKCHPAKTQSGETKLCVWVDERDETQKRLLEGRGFVKKDFAEYKRWRSLETPIPESPLPAGYAVRSLGDVDEHPARSWVSWRAFHPNDPDENYEGHEWYTNIQRAPLYRRDLDLVVVAPGGEFASFCTVWFDDVTRSAVFEPVGTSPEHQHRGLGKAVMCEGLRRAKRLGALSATIGSYSTAAHALYQSVGFVEYTLSEPWVKTYPKL